MFDIEQEINRIVEWLKQTAVERGKTKVLVAVSGGAESGVCAVICEKAFGRENVRLISVPYGPDSEYAAADTIASFTNLKKDTVNCRKAVDSLIESYRLNRPAYKYPVDEDALIKYVRTATIQGIAASQDALVIVPTTLSKFYLLGLDLCCPINECYPFLMYTRGEILQMGNFLGIPEDILIKGNKDFESRFQVTFGILDDFLRGIPTMSEKGEKRIKELHNKVVASVIDYHPYCLAFDEKNRVAAFSYT